MEINTTTGCELSIVLSLVISITFYAIVSLISSLKKIVNVKYRYSFSNIVFFILESIVSIFLDLFPLWMILFCFCFIVFNTLGQNIESNIFVKIFFPIQVFLDNKDNRLNLSLATFLITISYIYSYLQKVFNPSLKKSFIYTHNLLYVICCYYLWIVRIFKYDSNISILNNLTSLTTWNLVGFFGIWNAISFYMDEENPKITNRIQQFTVTSFFTISYATYLLGFLVNIIPVTQGFVEKIVIANYQENIINEILLLVPIVIWGMSIIPAFILIPHLKELTYLTLENKGLAEITPEEKRQIYSIEDIKDK